MGWWGHLGGPQQKGITQYCTFERDRSRLFSGCVLPFFCSPYLFFLLLFSYEISLIPTQSIYFHFLSFTSTSTATLWIVTSNLQTASFLQSFSHLSIPSSCHEGSSSWICLLRIQAYHLAGSLLCYPFRCWLVYREKEVPGSMERGNEVPIPVE